jgi:hypothetical protein
VSDGRQPGCIECSFSLLPVDAISRAFARNSEKQAEQKFRIVLSSGSRCAVVCQSDYISGTWQL